MAVQKTLWELRRDSRVHKAIIENDKKIIAGIHKKIDEDPNTYLKELAEIIYYLQEIVRTLQYTVDLHDRTY